MVAMRIIQNKQHNEHGLDLTSIVGKDRKNLSGAALRSFVNIAEIWQLAEKERLIVLGQPARSTYYSWIEKASKKDDITLPLDVLLRISAMLGIYKALRIIFHDREQSVKWLLSSNKGSSFAGQSPKEIMLSGTPDGLMLVRRFLDAWRGGLFVGPNEEAQQIMPIEPNDIVIV